MQNRSVILEQYDREGFYVFRDVVDADLMREATDHVAWLVARYPQFRPEDLHHPLMRDDAFWTRLVTDDRFLDIAEIFLGENLAIFTSHYICKPAQDGKSVLWHQDGAYWNLHPLHAITMWVAIDESTPENGCLQVVPGSHRLPLAALELRQDEPNLLHSASESAFADKVKREGPVVDVVMKPGDVSVHHPHLLHGSAANRSGKRRCGLSIGYIPTSTAVLSTGIYMYPLLARGSAVPGVNSYRPYPAYDPRLTIPFRNCNQWAGRAGSRQAPVQEDVALITHRMVERLKEGTTRA